MIFLPARPVSETHDSHKESMILNHESTAGCVKIVAKSLHLVFATYVLNVFFYLHSVLNNIGKNRYPKLPNSIAIITSLWKHVFSDMHRCRGVYL